MELKLGEIKDNRPLGRREIYAEVAHMGASTPTRQGLREAIAAQLGVKPELVYIRHVYTAFGAGISEIEAHVYDSEELAKRIEPLYVVARNAPDGKKLLEEAKKLKAERREKRRRKKRGAAGKK